MGSSEYEDEKSASGGSRTVSLDAYYIYKYEVTVAQYLAFCKATGRKQPKAPSFNPNWSNTDHPIVNVSWDDAKAYCEWAGGSLPTEAQWEKAARGEDGRKYPWGNEWDGSRCANSVSPNSLSSTKPVGSYPSGVSPYGVHDMAGNVWEWCNDFYEEDYYKSAPKSGTAHVLRGGSWFYINTDDFRCSSRSISSPANRSDVIGFRCVVRADA